jgi:hypothetical protein
MRHHDPKAKPSHQETDPENLDRLGHRQLLDLLASLRKEAKQVKRKRGRDRRGIGLGRLQAMRQRRVIKLVRAVRGSMRNPTAVDSDRIYGAFVGVCLQVEIRVA